MTPLRMEGTRTLQASLNAHNKVLRQEQGLWATLAFHSTNFDRVHNAQENVKIAFNDFLATNPGAAVVDHVKGWVIENARNPDALLQRLNAGK